MAKDKTYISDFPELIAEWDYEKNTDVSPDTVTSGCGRKVWWICSKGHSFQSKIANRTLLQRGCPYCTGRKVLTGYNDLLTTDPDIAAEWDYKKNEDLKPTLVSRGSNVKVWWLCKAYHHSWQERIANRTLHNQNCPYCSGRKVLIGFNDLQTTDPKLAGEWDYEKNQGLLPTMVTRFCNKKVWWKCPKHHSWKAIINNRSKGSGCPYCSGHRAIHGTTDLATTNPELIIEWDFEKNKQIDINTVKQGSNANVWWICSKCGYEWQSTVSNRTHGRGCPLCSNHAVLSGINDLATTNPDLLEEWDYNKNSSISPSTTYSKSSKKAWWICKKCGHSWQAIIRNRTEKGVGCPVCAGKACGKGINDLETLYPWLIDEFDYEKNDVQPSELAAHSATLVWWKCRECGGSWQTSLNNRTKSNFPTGCPYCNSDKHTSFPEQAIYYYTSPFFPEAISRYKIQGAKEFDIFIPSLNLAIEYDGVAWHTDQERDERKNKYCIENGIKLIRIREQGLPQLQTPCIVHTVTPYDMDELEKEIVTLLTVELKIAPDKIDVNISRDYAMIQAKYLKQKKNCSLSAVYPEIAEEWGRLKNGDLTPDKVTTGSGLKVWWKCKKCGYEWKATICDRTGKKRGCPKCQRQIAHKKYMSQMLRKTITLQEGYPEIAKEWHDTKNGEMTPDAIAAVSGKKVWWKCSTCGNEWQTVVANRTKQGAGCPKCASLKKRKQKRCRKVLCIETQVIYDSISDIQRELGIHRSSIIACCTGRHQTAGGFHWKYIDDK